MPYYSSYETDSDRTVLRWLRENTSTRGYTTGDISRGQPGWGLDRSTVYKCCQRLLGNGKIERANSQWDNPPRYRIAGGAGGSGAGNVDSDGKIVLLPNTSTYDYCSKSSPRGGWTCTVKAGHGGYCVARRGSQVLEVWMPGGERSQAYAQGYDNQCHERKPGYTCTATKGHGGLHTAHVDASEIVAVWSRRGSTSGTEGEFEEDYDKRCRDRSAGAGYHCSVRKGHTGKHVAHSGPGHVLKTWDNDGDMPYETRLSMWCDDTSGPGGHYCSRHRGHTGDHARHQADGRGYQVAGTWPRKGEGDDLLMAGSMSGVRGAAEWPGASPYSRSWCGERSAAGWSCNAKPDHPGNHTAYSGSDHILEVWPKGKDAGDGAQGKVSGRASCDAASPKTGFKCTARKSHKGLHTHHNGSYIPVETWPRDGETMPADVRYGKVQPLYKGEYYRPFHARGCNGRKEAVPSDCVCSLDIAYFEPGDEQAYAAEIKDMPPEKRKSFIAEHGKEAAKAAAA